MSLWIDDERWPPQGWYWARTSAEALEFIQNHHVTMISFDHDLGGPDTAMYVAKWIEESCWYGTMTEMPDWKIHSANPVGRKNLTAALESAQRGLEYNRCSSWTANSTDTAAS